MINQLQKGDIPELIIQDLQRPPSVAQIPNGKPRSASEFPSQSGWYFYKDVLKPYYPQIPVIICSYDVNHLDNIKQADDFNLVLVQKGIHLIQELFSVVKQLLSAQSKIHISNLIIPNVLIKDFKKINTQLLNHLAHNPMDLHKINWSAFEDLVTTLLRRLGYEVYHTPLTRDGGADIWAISRNDLGETQYVIDTKKYSPKRLVGPEFVRAIYGVAKMAGANVGMIVTTSRFSPEAVSLANQYRYQLSLKDFDNVIEWIRKVTNQK